MKRIFSFFILFTLLIYGSVAFAVQPLMEARCGGRIIKPGLSKNFLLNNCRPPDQTEQFTRGSQGRMANMERLYYYVDRFTYIVTVREGIIESINVEPR
jgi:hypothetical protein